jgi:hypothetical protein
MKRDQTPLKFVEPVNWAGVAHLAAAARTVSGPMASGGSIVDGFAQLNDNAATLFGAPSEGLRT